MSSVTYSSTRGGQNKLDFRTVVMQGLAHDRGLFVPDEIPTVSAEELAAWRDLSYADLSVQIIRKFVKDDQVPLSVLKDIIHRSCAAFRHPDVTPVIQVNGHAVLELFHGPTFAFKDVALQMLGNFFEYFLDTGSNGGQLTVLGATSGDTGSAAIAGLRGKRGVSCVILYPHGRVSHRQELQMITVPDENVYAVAVKDATFDDCQDFVKASFNTPAFRDKVHLGAVNSINWCRVLAQTTYYYWSYFRVTSSNSEKASFSVPTGNFGDILAGFYSKQMGLPVDKLIVATNENDILHRFFQTGKYERESIQETISPSMDICVSSNFERYLFWLTGNDASKLKKWMTDFEKTNVLSVSPVELQRAQNDFLSSRVNTAETISVIGEYHKSHNYLLCPHSAVGVKAIHNLKLVSPRTVCLATADQGKFPDAVRRAVKDPPTPDEIQALEKLPIRRFELTKDLKKVQDFVESRVVAAAKGRSFVSEHSLLLTAIAVSVLAVAFQMRKR